MKRLLRIVFWAAAATILASALHAVAQPSAKLPRVAYIWLFTDGPSGPYAAAFRQRMSQLGWIDGRNYLLEARGADGNAKELDAIMQELVQSKVDVIVAMCTPEALSARKFTTTIPIVMAATGDPVKAGLVQSLARPGGNVTGVTSMSLPLSAKRVALLKEAVPKLASATILWNPARPDNAPEVKTMQEAGNQLGVAIRSTEVRTRDELAMELDTLESAKTQALLNAGDMLVTSERRAIVDRAARLRIPAVYEDRVFVEAGGLMSYGPNLRVQHQRAADYVDKILKGAKAGDLPIEQPTRFELVVNKKAAAALGLVIPSSVLLQADEVLE